MFCVDSDFIIDILNDIPEARELLISIEEQGEVQVPAVSVFELTCSAGRLSDRRKEELLDLINDLEVLPFDRGAAVLSGEIGSELVRKGEGIDVMDLLIGCTALSRDMKLVTRNNRHFERIPGLRLQGW